MNDIKTFIIYVIGAIATLLAPIQYFMTAMLLLFGANFLFGIIAAVINDEPWSFKKAYKFFLHVGIFLLVACLVFSIGHYMNNEKEAISVVKILCYLTIYIFGTNIFRNLCNIAPKGSSWYKLFDLCYYVLSVKFIEKFNIVKKWQEERKEVNHNTILDKDDN